MSNLNDIKETKSDSCKLDKFPRKQILTECNYTWDETEMHARKMCNNEFLVNPILEENLYDHISTKPNINKKWGENYSEKSAFDEPFDDHENKNTRAHEVFSIKSVKHDDDCNHSTNMQQIQELCSVEFTVNPILEENLHDNNSQKPNIDGERTGSYSEKSPFEELFHGPSSRDTEDFLIKSDGHDYVYDHALDKQQIHELGSVECTVKPILQENLRETIFEKKNVNKECNAMCLEKPVLNDLLCDHENEKSQDNDVLSEKSLVHDDICNHTPEKDQIYELCSVEFSVNPILPENLREDNSQKSHIKEKCNGKYFENSVLHETLHDPSNMKSQSNEVISVKSISHNNFCDSTAKESVTGEFTYLHPNAKACPKKALFEKSPNHDDVCNHTVEMLQIHDTCNNIFPEKPALVEDHIKEISHVFRVCIEAFSLISSNGDFSDYVNKLPHIHGFRNDSMSLKSFVDNTNASTPVSNKSEVHIEFSQKLTSDDNLCESITKKSHGHETCSEECSVKSVINDNICHRAFEKFNNQEETIDNSSDNISKKTCAYEVMENFSTKSVSDENNSANTNEKTNIISVCSAEFYMKSAVEEHFHDHVTMNLHVSEVSESYDRKINSSEAFFKCELCKKSFSQKSNLTRHYRIHTGEKPYSCEVCGREFSSNYCLRIHLQDCHNENRYKCDLCCKSYSRKVQLNYHYRVHTSKKRYICDVCGKRFSTENKFNIHRLNHTQGKTHSYASKMCNNPFSENFTLNRHTGNLSSKTLFKCEICEKDFSKKTNLTRHYRIHTGEKPYNCEVCSKKFSHKHSLRNHLYVRHNENLYKCEECSKGYSRKAELNEHCVEHAPKYASEKNSNQEKGSEEHTRTMLLNEHLSDDASGKGIFPENENTGLSRKFDFQPISSNLHRHFHMHTQGKTNGRKTYACEKCFKIFYFKSSLKDHLNLHSSENPYVCKICRKEFTRKSNLDRHIRVHSKGNLHTSKILDKRLSEKNCLRVHRRIHTGIKPYVCEICKKDFSQKSNLTRHYRIHTGEKPYNCEVCYKEFSNKNSLRYHLYVRHNENLYKCEVCDKGYSRKTELNEHFLEHAPEYALQRNSSQEKGSEGYTRKVQLNDHLSKDASDKNTFLEKENTRVSKKVDFQPISSNLHKRFHMHTQEKPNGKKNYACEKCDKIFYWQSSLKDHLHLHSNENPYVCEICRKEFTKQTNLDSHLRAHRKEKPYVCEICDKRFSQKKNLIAHRRIHTGEKPYVCEICTKGFRQKSNLTRHYRIHKRISLRYPLHVRHNENLYKCEVCDKEYSTKTELNEHFVEHVPEHSFEGNSPQEEGREGYTRTMQLNKHLFEDASDKSIFPEKENTGLTRNAYFQPISSNLRKHFHSQEKSNVRETYACEKCDKIFYWKSSLKDHLHLHSSENPYVCKICRKEFTKQTNFDRHLRSHSKDKPYICEICDKRFTQKNGLIVHRRIHTGEQPYVCEICKKNFRRKSNLTRHYRIHTKEKPYNCEVCYEEFSNNNSLRNHLHVRHNKNLYKCGVCDKEYSRKTELNEHFVEHAFERNSSNGEGNEEYLRTVKLN